MARSTLLLLIIFCTTKVFARTSDLWSAAYLNNFGAIEVKNSSGSLGSVPRQTTGFGAFYEHPLGKKISLEAGLLFNPYQYRYYNSSLNRHYLRRFDAFEVPLSLRYPLLERYIFVGGGLYLRQGIGSVYTKVDDGSAEVATGFSEANLKALDYGLHGLIAFELPLFDSFSLFAGGRYNYSMTNASTLPGARGTFQSYYFLAGIMFGER